MQRSSTLVALGFAAGLGTGLVAAAVPAHARPGESDDTYRKLRVFSQVLTYVQQSYVEPLKGEDLVYNAISGMLSGLDPHTTFMRPAEYEKLREDTAGEFGGLGIEIGQAPDGILVEVVVPDGPASHAGLKIGDRIQTIDGMSTQGVSIEGTVHLLRGVPGTRVLLGVARNGWDKSRDVPLIRRQVRVPSVEHDELSPGVGYVRIRSFQERTDQELAAALADLRKQARSRSKDKLEGLVIDLRDNPGGLLDEGVKVADRFLSEGVIVSTQGRNPRSGEKEMAHPDGTEEAYPVILVVNQGTASASEIVAGALQDHGRALVVGTRSYGKGSVQTLFGLDDGSGLKLTIARYYTPSGRSIQDKGVQPDLPVEEGLPDGSIDLTAALQARGPARLAMDRQLKAAYDAVRAAREGKPMGKSLARVPPEPRPDAPRGQRQ